MAHDETAHNAPAIWMLCGYGDRKTGMRVTNANAIHTDIAQQTNICEMQPQSMFPFHNACLQGITALKKLRDFSLL